MFCRTTSLLMISHLEHIKIINQPAVQNRKVLHLYGVVFIKVGILSSQLTNNLSPNSNSWDLRSHRVVYHSGKLKIVGLIPISFDAFSITLRDRPFVKGSAK